MLGDKNCTNKCVNGGMREVVLSVEKHYLRTFNCNSCSGDDCVYIKIPRSAESEASRNGGARYCDRYLNLYWKQPERVGYQST